MQLMINFPLTSARARQESCDEWSHSSSEPTAWEAYATVAETAECEGHQNVRQCTCTVRRKGFPTHCAAGSASTCTVWSRSTCACHHCLQSTLDNGALSTARSGTARTAGSSCDLCFFCPVGQNGNGIRIIHTLYHFFCIIYLIILNRFAPYYSHTYHKYIYNYYIHIYNCVKIYQLLF